MTNIIIEDKPYRFGKHRSEQEKNLREDWGCQTMSDEQLDRCKYIEKKSGCDRSFLDKKEIDSLGGDTHFGHDIKTRPNNKKFNENYDLIKWDHSNKGGN